jgi:nucleoside-diphosphate-sugar epimerase
MSDSDLVVNYMHYRGKNNTDLTEEQHVEVRRLANGFGPEPTVEMFWDWSHVRDSSDAAIKAMANKIRSFIN